MAQAKKRPPSKSTAKASATPADIAASSVPNIDRFISDVSAGGMALKELTPLVKDQAANTFDAYYAEECQTLDTTIKEYEEQYNLSTEKINDTHKDLMNTDRTKKAVDVVGGKKQPATAEGDVAEGTPTPKMGVLDICIAVSAFALGGFLSLMWATAIYTTIMASGSPVFLEQPMLAMMLSALFPIGAIALDLFGTWLPHDRAKRLYTFTIYGLMAIFLMWWVVLFAMNFDAASAGIDWDAMAEGTDSGKGGKAFIVVQLLAEMFTASSLFIFATDRVSMFRTWSRFHNPSYYEKKDTLKELRAERDRWTDKLNQAKGRKAAIEAGKEVYVANNIALLIKHTARFKSDDQAQ